MKHYGTHRHILDHEMGSKGQNLFYKVVMLHLNLKRMEHIAYTITYSVFTRSLCHKLWVKRSKQLVLSRCISRSQRLKIDLQDEKA